MNNDELDDYLKFVDVEMKKIKRKIDMRCAGVTNESNAIDDYVELVYTMENVSLAAGFELAGSRNWKLGFAYLILMRLEYFVREKNLKKIFEQYGLLIELVTEFSKEEIYKLRKSKKMKEYALLRLANDPKQKALDEIKSQYEVVKHQFRRRGFSAQFVKNMAERYQIIESPKTIERLVAKLNKINKPPVS